MTHYAAYWTFFDKPGEGGEEKVVKCWRTGPKSSLANVTKGDILWLFTSGRKCEKSLEEHKLSAGGVEVSQAYLTEVFTVFEVVPDGRGRFKLRLQGATGKCIGLCPPILIDDIVRPDGWEKDEPIGKLRQRAWRLPAHIADQLQTKLKQESAVDYHKIFG